eukprot:GHVR01025388.1.p1 GENE.GHVR01025388.1~~GHVR01025388.1.p1  ORF type:complete len:116 (-),score=74.50 GHVR01025388.1:101-448(-)
MRCLIGLKGIFSSLTLLSNNWMIYTHLINLLLYSIASQTYNIFTRWVCVWLTLAITKHAHELKDIYTHTHTHTHTHLVSNSLHPLHNLYSLYTHIHGQIQTRTHTHTHTHTHTQE